MDSATSSQYTNTPLRHQSWKLLGTLASAILQIVLLMISLSVIAGISNGIVTSLGGTDWLQLTLLILSIAITVSGASVFVVGLAPTPEQAGLLGSLVTLGLALLGGAFGFQLGEMQNCP